MVYANYADVLPTSPFPRQETCEPSNYKPVYLKYFFFVSIVSSLEENAYLVQKEQYGSRDLATLIATRQYSELLI